MPPASALVTTIVTLHTANVSECDAYKVETRCGVYTHGGTVGPKQYDGFPNRDDVPFSRYLRDMNV
jgi:hypothetical protein